MKNNRIIIWILFFASLTTKAWAQWSETFNYKGAWSPWHSVIEGGREGSLSYYRDGSGIILTTPGGIVYFKFRIINYLPPTQKQIKEHYRSKQWFKYTGTVEYYVNDIYPTAEAFAKAGFFVKPDPRLDQTPSVLRKTSCTIQIAPYRSIPKNYNVWFDDIGVGISARGMSIKNPNRKARRIVANVLQSVLLFPFGVGSWWWLPINQ